MSHPPLFEVCETADELEKYLRHWLGLDLPWHTVDPESTSSPLKFIWSVYKVLMTDNGPHTHILASSRNCMKTLTSSTLQFLSMLHFRRDGVHISATLDQSSQAILYLDGFLRIPELAQYQNKDSVKIKQLINLPPNKFTSKPDARLKVVTATKKGANSARSSLITFDEVDLTPQEILDEAAWIADPTRDKQFSPVFVYLSSRKTNNGPVQYLLDKAERENTGDEKVHKWSATDFMKACPPEVHKPEKGKVMAYVHSETLQTIWSAEAFNSVVPEAGRSQYKEYAVFEGCRTCPAFIPCFGFSAKQKGESKALRSIKITTGIFKKIKDPSVIISQGLNWKPETTAIVFKNFSRDKHVKDPIEFYRWVTGEYFNPLGLDDEEIERIEDEGDIVKLTAITPTKAHIYEGMVKAGWTIISGVDFGFNPDPAVSVIAGFHKRQKRGAVLTLESANGFANHLWAEHTCKNLFNKYPVEFVGPDTADAAALSYFGKHKVMAVGPKPSRIETGVSFIRGLLWNPILQQSNFAILDDSQSDNKNIMMIEDFEHWTHKKTPLGFDMGRFEDGDHTHTLDSLRYAFAPFQEDLKISADVRVGIAPVSIEFEAARGNPEALQVLKEKAEVMSQFQEHLSQFGIDNAFGKPKIESPSAPKKPSGGVKFKF